jgi:hypothetical protein
MKTIVMLVLVSMLMIVAAPAYAGEAMQMWRCELEDGVSEAEVKAMALKWLNAAKKTPGGENLRAFVNFPVAVNATGKIDLLWVVVAPSFAEWGTFWDNYATSPVAELDKENRGKVICPDSALWETVRVK